MCIFLRAYFEVNELGNNSLHSDEIHGFFYFLKCPHILFSLSPINHRMFFSLPKYILADNRKHVIKKVFTCEVLVF